MAWINNEPKIFISNAHEAQLYEKEENELFPIEEVYDIHIKDNKKRTRMNDANDAK